jgi:hypothetical protein
MKLHAFGCCLGSFAFAAGRNPRGDEHATFSVPVFSTRGNDEIADVATHIRNCQGNRAPSVTQQRRCRQTVPRRRHHAALKPYVEVVLLVEVLVGGVIAPVRFSWFKDPTSSPTANAPAPTYRAVMAQSISWAFWTPAGFPGANGPWVSAAKRLVAISEAARVVASRTRSM